MPAEKTPGAIDAEVIKEPSLKEILDDRANSRDFNKWLEGQGKSELGAKLVTGKLESADIDQLAEERENFWKRKTEAGEMKSLIGSEGTLEHFVKNFAELRRIKELVGEAGLKEAMVTVVDGMSIEAGDEHKDFYKICTDWRTAAVKVGEAKKVVSELLKGTHLDGKDKDAEREAKELSLIDDPAEREQRIKDYLVSKKKGPAGEKGFWMWKKKAWTKEQEALIGASVEKFSNEPIDGETKSGLEKIQELEAMIGAYKVKQQEIVLDLSFILSNKGAGEINRIIMGEKKEPDSTIGFKEMRQELERMTKPDATANDFFSFADKEFSKFVDEEQLPLNEDDEREEAVNQFFTKFAETRAYAHSAKLSGVWFELYKAVVEPFLEDIIPELKKEIKIDENRGKLFRKKKK